VLARFPEGQVPGFLSRLGGGSAKADEAEARRALTGRLAGLEPAARHTAVIEYLTALAAGILRLSPGAVAADQPLTRLGFDSLMAVELRNRAQAELGRDILLARLLAGASVADLAADLAPATPSVPASPASAPAAEDFVEGDL
jgi:acyl carrier protein